MRLDRNRLPDLQAIGNKHAVKLFGLRSLQAHSESLLKLLSIERLVPRNHPDLLMSPAEFEAAVYYLRHEGHNVFLAGDSQWAILRQAPRVDRL